MYRISFYMRGGKRISIGGLSLGDKSPEQQLDDIFNANFFTGTNQETQNIIKIKMSEVAGLAIEKDKEDKDAKEA